MPLLLPHSELVAVAWIRSVPGMLSSVGTTLSGDIDSWAENGFYQLSIVGGRPHRDVPLSSPLIQIDAFAANPNGAKPPWGAANQMCEVVKANTYNRIADANPSRRHVTLPAAYHPALVQTVEVVTEPRRMVGDEVRIAHYTMDAIFTWIPVIT